NRATVGPPRRTYATSFAGGVCGPKPPGRRRKNPATVAGGLGKLAVANSVGRAWYWQDDARPSAGGKIRSALRGAVSSFFRRQGPACGNHRSTARTRVWQTHHPVHR